VSPALPQLQQAQARAQTTRSGQEKPQPPQGQR
jgi:hypothetical protein